MGIGSYKEAQRYRMRTNKNLTRGFYLDTKRTLDQEPFALEQVQNTPAPETDYQTEVELANGGRVNFSEGSKLTGTGKTLEQNIKDDHKAFNDYRKSIGQSTIPLDNDFIKMWQRTRLSSGGSVKKEAPKFIPMDLESVAFRLFQDNLDNLSYNQKQTVYNYIEDNRNKKAEGGTIQSEDYYQEIPTLTSADPIDILEQQLINEKDPIKIEKLKNELNQIKEELIAKETAKEEEKRIQKEKGVKYREDFPSDTAYVLETGKQLLTNPKYTLGKLGKGVVEGTEFLGGQFGKTVLGIGEFDPSKSILENALYTPVAGEKLGINKFIEKNIPKDPTTGTLMGGEALEIAGSFLGPLEIYQLMKGAQTPKALEKKLSTIKIDEKIDPTRRDILKTGAVMGGGALLYPTAKKLGMFDELAKATKAIPKKAAFVKIVKPFGVTETKFPEWFPSLVNRLRKEGNQKPIYATKEISLTKEEYLKLREKGTDRIYDRYLGRTQNYVDELKQKSVPQHYQIKDTDDIIGYEYMDKNIPDVKAVEYNGEEMNVYFKNNYGQSVEIQYVAPGKKNKEGQFAVADARPEPGSGYDSAPDFEQVYVKDIDEVLGGSGEVEQYATKTKTRRSTKGAEEFDDNEMRALMEIDRLKDEGIIE
jgi:hypothetical protein